MTVNKVINIFTLIAIPFFLLGLIVALIPAFLTGNYNITSNSISELGSILYTPFPGIMNATFIISPIFLSFYFVKLFKIVYKYVKDHKTFNNLSIAGFSLFGIMNIGFFFAGIFNVDISRLLHNISTIFVFIPLLAAEIIIGSIILIHNITHKYIAVLMIFGQLFMSFLYFILQTPLLEWLIFFVLLLWGLPLSIKIIRHKDF